MRYLRWDETLFRNYEVFDEDYLPEEYLHRETQLNRLVSNLKPALRGARPVNCLCLGPPGTGKTTAVKLIFKDLSEFEGVIPVYVNCQIMNSKQQVFAKIFRAVYGYEPPSYGVPFTKLYYSVMKGIGERVLVVALDDLNFLLSEEVANEVLYALLKAHEEVEGVKVGIVGIATDVKLAARLDERVSSVFHPDEIHFPLYGFEEIRDILASRARFGFYPGVLSDEALDKIAELCYEYGDLRFGIYLMKLAGLEAEREASRRIELRHVEAVYEGSRRVFLKKSVQALSDHERVLLGLIYSSDELTTGELYRRFKEMTAVGYTKFYEMLSKLESIRLIDTRFEQRGGRTRAIIKRYEPALVLDALEEF
ncbi:ORC1-type DNA replication protein [Archaeoglobus veneficus]|uniref:ORC1-type DNA replication protein n=1 Tax=Archaeoglobus veneficus (strain DSM 11195 / SNP6) TaxID=693661 RepID=F2KNR2_ARCVS|nr:ORC1-type DNA replication protein [Archaeoglobus veneficus]AEA47389.1 Cell division control protein 6-like protein [Archaeoglobus veneficus SNP6]